MGGIGAVVTITGADAGGDPVTIGGDKSTRRLHFDVDHFVVAKDTATIPHRVVVRLREAASLEARIAALEEQLADDGTVEVDTIVVKTIVAKGTGNAPSASVPDLAIVTQTQVPGVYDPLVWFVAANPADMTPAAKLSFFGVDAVAPAEITTGFDADDVQDKLEALGLIVEVP